MATKPLTEKELAELGFLSTKVCEICGRVFSRKENISWPQWGKTRFCSHKCHGKFLERDVRELCTLSRPQFRVRIKQILLDECAICGWNETPCDIAHIEPGINTLENVVILCPNHHRMYDRGMIPKEAILEAKLQAERKQIDDAC